MSPVRTPTQWLPAPEPGLRIKPSLRAAASIFAKVAGLVLFLVTLPVVVAVLAGSGAALLGAFLAAQFGLVAMVPAFIGLLVPAVRLLGTRYELDEAGVRVHSSIIARQEQRVTWDKVTLLLQRRSLVDRVLGIESVSVVAYGVRGTTLDLVGLRNAAPVRAYAARRMRESASVAALFDND